MVNYPNQKRSTQIGAHVNTKIGADHRGMHLEEDLNTTNTYYLAHDIAVIYKKPTPIQIVKVDYPKRSAAKITEAYYRTPSTTDYNVLYRGKYIDFEAKETRKMVFPFSNITEHQVKHLQNIVNHKGIAFIIIAFTTKNEVYLVDASYFIDHYTRQEKKGISYEQIKSDGHLVPQGYNPRLGYLQIVDTLYF